MHAMVTLTTGSTVLAEIVFDYPDSDLIVVNGPSVSGLTLRERTVARSAIIRRASR